MGTTAPGASATPSAAAPAAAAKGERQIVGSVKAPAGAANLTQVQPLTQVLPATRVVATAAASLSGEVDLPQAIVYLIQQDDTLWSKDGKVVFALTDAQGRFAFPDVPDQPVLVAAVLPGNRRLAGLVRPQAGENRVEVSLATTYVAAYLRDRARAAEKPLDKYPLGSLARLSALTRDRLAAGDLAAEPDLGVDATGDLARAYSVVVASKDAELAKAWSDLLGTGTPAVQTLAPPALPAGQVRSVAVAASGDIFVGEIGDLAAQVGVLPGGGTRRTFLSGSRVTRQFGLPAVLGFEADGSLFLGDGFSGLVRRFKPSTVRGTDIDLVPVETGWSVAGQAQEIPAIPTKSFRDLHPKALDISPRGVAFGADGTIYVADARNHRVVAVSPSGETRRVAGLAPAPNFDSNALAAFSGDGGPATRAGLAAPNGVAWRPEGASGSLYVADTDNHRIRKVDLATGVITTVAGSGPGYSRADPAPGEFGGDGGPATAARLKYPNRVAFLPDGAMLVADTGNQRVRVVEKDGTIRTLAGGNPGKAGATAADGPADATVLGQVYDLAVDAAGDILLAADDKGLRKLWLRFGR